MVHNMSYYLHMPNGTDIVNLASILQKYFHRADIFYIFDVYQTYAETNNKLKFRSIFMSLFNLYIIMRQ